MSFWFPIFGALFLIFRIWLVEVKVPDALAHKKRYVSRFLTYYYAIAMILSFESAFFNIAIAASVPSMIVIFFIKDLKYIRRNTGRNVKEESPVRHWMLVERWTLHPPLIITGLYWYTIGLKSVLLSTAPPLYLAILSIVFPVATFMIIDCRWSHRKETVLGYAIPIAGVISGLIMILYLYL